MLTVVSVVIPVYYNEESLEPMIERLSAVADASDHGFEFLFVDDGSGDASLKILRRVADSDPRVRVISLSRNFGSNAAILAGLTYASGDCVVVLSADLQDPPELIPGLLDQWHRGNQVVLAARRRRTDPLLAKLFALTFNRLFRWLVFSEFPPQGFDFMLLDRRVVDVLVQMCERNSYLFGLVMWVGFRRAIVYYDRQERRLGRSRWTTSRKIKYFIDAFTAFSYLPLRVTGVLGFALALLGFVYAAVVVVLRVVRQVPVTGWASLTVIVLLTSGAQLLIIGLLGEYLWRTLDESRRRPLFVVDALINVGTPDRGGRPSIPNAVGPHVR